LSLQSREIVAGFSALRLFSEGALRVHSGMLARLAPTIQPFRRKTLSISELTDIINRQSSPSIQLLNAARNIRLTLEEI